jgi:hypothetical protein
VPIVLGSFDDRRWARIKSPIPEPLSAENDARLRIAILACCSSFLTRRAYLQERTDSAAALRRPGKGQLAPFERVAKGLRMAADAWKQIGKIHDDHLGDIDLYDKLEAMARDAERRLTALGKLAKPVTTLEPWPEFVRKVAQCCHDVGLKPTWTGRVYDEKHAEPTWFQKFMAALDKNLLGSKGLLGMDKKGKQFERDHRALYAEVAKVMGGDKKQGKARR